MSSAGGLNINSPIVQSMLQNTPMGIGNMGIPFYAGNTPMVETTTMSSPPQANPSPFQMLTGIGMQGYQLPTYQFQGALATQPAGVPSYFDVGQPISHVPSSGLGAAPIIPPNYNQPIYPYQMGGYYYNPYMAGGIRLPYQTPEQMAKYQYARSLGFESVEEMELNDLSVKKRLVQISGSSSGYDQEVIDKVIKVRYDEPYEKRKTYNPLTPLNVNHEKQISLKVKIIKGEETIYESRNGFNNGYQSPIVKNINFVVARMNEERARRDMWNYQMYSTALERKYDSFDIVQFFNEAFYDLDMKYIEILSRSQNNQRIGMMYDRDWFRRQITKRYGPPAARNRLIREDELNEQRGQSYASTTLQGGYGFLPGGVPLSPTTDPNFGYCFSVNPATGRIDLTAPRRDHELESMRARFINTIGRG